MKILIVTQKVDSTDPILGFFHEWIVEFAKKCEKVTVICLEQGKYALPPNVHVLSLGKEKKVSKLTYLFRFYRCIFRYRKEYDAVFVHMNPIYVILGWKMWFLMRKKIGLWYTHKTVDLKLRLATLFARVIFTASKESFRITTKKCHVVGHGIDTNLFRPSERPRIYQENEAFRIIVVGRLSRIKYNDRILDAVATLAKKGKNIQLSFIGEAITEEDKIHSLELQRKASQIIAPSSVLFFGGILHRDVPEHLRNAHLFVTMSDTGSLDKALLEALATGIPVLVSNPAGAAVLSQAGFSEGILLPTDGLALKIEESMRTYKEASEHAWETLPSFVTKNHGLETLISKILILLS